MHSIQHIMIIHYKKDIQKFKIIFESKFNNTNSIILISNSIVILKAT
jgi:hypothetical protein